ELQESRELIESRTGRKAEHLAYPFGDIASAGRREFEIARQCGFATAVTTRPGMLFGRHAGHLTALPRLAVHGAWQDRASFETLLSGAPFALWNLGRRVSAG
ncbi:MAG: polysaccharide deacetylase, partial [Beijerinckiaceae bacterium]|nr:polysaccharide deacetylase [Beijerinckiaceae bacterium]